MGWLLFFFVAWACFGGAFVMFMHAATSGPTPPPPGLTPAPAPEQSPEDPQ